MQNTEYEFKKYFKVVKYFKSFLKIAIIKQKYLKTNF